MGTFLKEKMSSPFIGDVKAALKEADLELHDIASAVGSILAVKDEQELSMIRKASDVTTSLFNKYLKEQIMDIIDQDKVFFIIFILKY